MVSFALRRFAAVLAVLLLLVAAAVFGVPDGAAALTRTADGLPVTLGLAGGALVTGLAAGAPLGLAAGLRPGSVIARLAGGVITLGAAVPGFLAVALVLAVLGDRVPMAALLVLALPILGETARLARLGADSVERDGFVLSARGRGVSERDAWRRHAVPAALVPVAGALGSLGAVCVAGAVAAESLCGLPGAGQQLVEAARAGDAAGTVAAAALLAGLVLALHGLGAVARGALDPRARSGWLHG